jgi:hypothetical protein
VDRWIGGPVRPVGGGPVDRWTSETGEISERWTGETGETGERWTGGRWTGDSPSTLHL